MSGVVVLSVLCLCVWCLVWPLQVAEEHSHGPATSGSSSGWCGDGEGAPCRHGRVGHSGMPCQGAHCGGCVVWGCTVQYMGCWRAPHPQQRSHRPGYARIHSAPGSQAGPSSVSTVVGDYTGIPSTADFLAFSAQSHFLAIRPVRNTVHSTQYCIHQYPFSQSTTYSRLSAPCDWKAAKLVKNRAATSAGWLMAAV